MSQVYMKDKDTAEDFAYVYIETSAGALRRISKDAFLKAVESLLSGGSDYTLPTATESKLGGVMPVTKTSAMTQDVGVDSEGKLYTAPGSGTGSSYTLPAATADDLGGIKADTKGDTDTVPAKIGADQKMYVPAYPTTLKNPNALTFTGAAKGAYDGSSPLTVNIPSGEDAGGNGGITEEVICNITTTEEVTSIIEQLTDELIEKLKKAKEIFINFYMVRPEAYEDYTSAALSIFGIYSNASATGGWTVLDFNSAYLANLKVPLESYVPRASYAQSVTCNCIPADENQTANWMESPGVYVIQRQNQGIICGAAGGFIAFDNLTTSNAITIASPVPFGVGTRFVMSIRY